MNSLVVKSAGGAAYAGLLIWKEKSYPCALGKSGITKDKHEGDNATPEGEFALREVWYRADRLEKPRAKLPTREITAADGWSDDVNKTDYNKHVTLPYEGSHESLWREDDVYDLVVPIGYNDNPPVPGKGSAIFIHIAREGFTPTAGCIALRKEDLLNILAEIEPDTRITITS